MCEYHEEVFKTIEPEVITIIEKFTPQLQEVVNLIGSKIAPFIFTPGAKFGENGVIEPLPENTPIPEPMQRMLNTAGLLYIIAWLAAETSPSETYDELLSVVFANGINDGNAYVCVNKSKGN